jgi:predicted kinase
MKVYILRGISGAGKSTYARYLQKTEGEVLICSADAYMDDGNGGYHFDSRRLEDAHKYCLRTFIDGLQKRWPVIVLDNTNITWHEFRPYVVVAEAFDYEVEIVMITVDPEMAADRTRHDVPLKSLKSRFKALHDDLKRAAIPQRIHQRVVAAGSPSWQRWGRYGLDDSDH